MNLYTDRLLCLKSIPGILTLELGRTAVKRQDLSVNPLGLLTSKEANNTGDINRIPIPHQR